ncbi:hypothetical protein [Streptomyces luteogriseus]|uniref:hypothetical protein n=1 Tax=Streptomyces luteogriseus TaxID=68233 RepID=UPI002613C2AA|nr:hypothetical protein [uncultured Streptomyces sp.]
MRPGTGGEQHDPQAVPGADESAGTVRLATEKRVSVDHPWAGASGFLTGARPVLHRTGGSADRQFHSRARTSRSPAP